jgi:Tfp pilus assembly protein PilN
VDDDRNRVVVVERNNARPSRAFALAPETKQEVASLAEIRRAIRKEWARFDLLVPEEFVARRRMKVPQTAKDNLRETLNMELDRFTRFEHTKVYFDHAVVETNHEAGTITLDLAIVERAVVDEPTTALRNAGLRPSGAHLWKEGAKSPDASFFSLPAGPSVRTVRLTTAALVALVLALDIAAAYAPLGLKIDALVDLQARLEIIKPKVERALELERTLTELRNRDAYLIALRNQAPSMSEVAGELARALPDSAWLEQLQIGEGRVQLEGFAGVSAELVAALDDSPLMSDVRFEWPVSADATVSADRFDISARLGRSNRSRQ